MIRLTLAVLLLAVLTVPARAAQLLGQFEAGDAVATEINGDKVCFMSSPPEKEEGNYSNRGTTTLFVTHWPAQDKLNEISIKAGYTYESDSEVTVDIGGEEWTLWTDGDHAWAYDSKDESALIDAMKGGLTAIVIGISNRGTKTTDTYSLKGFTAAHGAITKACGG